MPAVVDESVRMDLEDIIATPVVGSFAPAAGRYGTEVTIIGKRFSETAAKNSVHFNGVPARIVSASETELKVLVPTHSATGTLKIITPDGTASTTDHFEVYQPPVLSSFSPAEGTAGSIVILKGNHLAPETVQSIKLGAIFCKIVNTTDKVLAVRVPEQAETSTFEIITKGGETVSSSAFVVWHQPSISNLSKNAEITGASISIYGEYFAPQAERNLVLFGQAQAQVLYATAKQLTVKVPHGAASGFISVETPGGKVTSTTYFEVIPGPTFVAMAPTRGNVGTEVVISGAHFGTLGIQDEISFNGEKGLVLEASANRYKVRVPSGATSGKVKITGVGGVAYSITDFEVEELTPSQAIAVYPNPTTGHFAISFKRAGFDIQDVQIYNAMGVFIYRANMDTPQPDELIVNLEGVKSGLYMIQFKTDRGIVFKKITVL